MIFSLASAGNSYLKQAKYLYEWRNVICKIDKRKQLFFRVLFHCVHEISIKHLHQNTNFFHGYMIEISLLRPYLEFFWSAFFHIWTKYDDLIFKSSYSVQMQKNTDYKNFKYGHILRTVIFWSQFNKTRDIISLKNSLPLMST